MHHCGLRDAVVESFASHRSSNIAGYSLNLCDIGLKNGYRRDNEGDDESGEVVTIGAITLTDAFLCIEHLSHISTKRTKIYC